MAAEHRGVQFILGTYGGEVVVEEGLRCRSTAYNADGENEGGCEESGRI
jgi:hypothetical protein